MDPCRRDSQDVVNSLLLVHALLERQYARVGMIAITIGIGLWSPGCAMMRVGPAAEIQDLRSQDQAEENLAAVRALQAQVDRREWMAEETVPSPTPGADSSTRNPDQLSQLAPLQRQSLRPSSAASSRRKHDGMATLPWTPPPLSSPAPPDRSVPAYTTPAPVGPDYTGTTRCVPDGMGGQRCGAR